MATRTVQFCGYAIGDEPARIVATFNNTTVFTGNVEPTANIDSTVVPYPVMYTCEIDNTVSGNISMSLENAGGNSTILSGQIFANYANIEVTSGTIGGVFYANIETYSGNIDAISDSDANTFVIAYSTSGSAGFVDINNQYQTDSGRNADYRYNSVQINGVQQSRGETPAGTWSYYIPPGSTLTCTVEVSPGLSG